MCLDKSLENVMLKLFLIVGPSFITNLFLKGKLSIKNFIWRSLKDYEMESDGSNLKNRYQIIVFFYRTKLLGISLCLWKSQRHDFHSGTSSLFSQLSTSRFLPISMAENEIEGKPFSEFRWGERKCVESIEEPLKRWIPRVYWTLLWMLEEVCECRKKVLWRPIR